ncbi:MAG: class I SAM-dependent methyltransferase [Rhodospirillum sp.]|nr:class I SAM-dependent methyltransferase [Rhodospirillum sp.]MCF8488864.1 class I SAM-dependent methyltransferase [Rhodospirillum sp.]MCF8502925.1 class I SAM-dependent methyltransferase [Rhodospirillum sp.]
MSDNSPSHDPSPSWEANAASWTRAVREGWIPSRAQATDTAVLDRLKALAPKTLLDLGCGEGWLCRTIREHRSVSTYGIDAVPALVAAAQSADPEGTYATVSQAAIASGAWAPSGLFDVICANYALFTEDLSPLLTALGHVLAPGGHLVIQTLHPWSAWTEGDYQSGWRTEDFSGFADGTWTPMPWFSRTLEDWMSVLLRSGLRLQDLREPLGGTPRRPLSLLMTCAKG